MENLKTLFNCSKTTEDVVKSLSPQEKINLAYDLLQFCSENNDPPKKFVDILLKIVLFQDVCLNIFLNIRQELIPGIMILITEEGDTLFDSFSIGTKESARCVLNALETCINYPNKEVRRKGILKIAESPIFCVILSSCKYFFNQEVLSIGKTVLAAYENIPSFKVVMINQGLFIRPKHEKIMFNRNEILVSLLLSTNIDNLSTTIFSFTGLTSSFYKFYANCVKCFINKPTLEYAYLITNKLVTIHSSLSNRSNSDEVEIRNIIENVRNIDPSLMPDQYITTLTSNITSVQLDPNTVFDNALLYPMAVTEVIPNIMKCIQANDNSAVITTTNIMKRIDDFIRLLLWQTQLLPTLTSFNDILPFTKPKAHSSILLLIATIIRKVWGYGNKTLRNEICLFIVSINDVQIRNFLTQIKDPSSKQTYETATISPFLSEFLRNYNRISSPDDLLAEKNSFVLLLKGMEKEYSKNAINTILKNGLPNGDLYSILFFQLTVEKSNKIMSYLTAATQPDYDVMVHVPPPTLDAVSQIILDQISVLSQDNFITSNEINDIIITWAAWSTTFGFEHFCTVLFEKLYWKIGRDSLASDVIGMFIAVGEAIIILINRCGYNVDSVIDVIKKNINSIDSFASAEGMAELSLRLVWESEGDWTFRFDTLIEFCKTTYRTSKNMQARHFAITFIKKSLNVNKINRRIKLDVLPDLIEDGTAKTLMEYFNVLTLSLNQ